ncbi:MAG: bifunctional (p)ppGpp synthetase/guanosine-3',5'-bis(diphosphate) 3'-pyrophosphohydrolase [Chloroflexi bacterium]|nr:bifunctional (p)ppGpp synthetase/guanosine-3',5'-bis(diphosphate) 3'-pyrophosphohydrolase [Chloroflexota bacterium]
MAEIKELLEKAKEYIPADKLALVERAYSFAAQAHKGQTRLSGGPYIEHPLQTALLLVELHLDATTLASALLHDVVEDCGIAVEELSKGFGPEVARLVDGVTKLAKIDLMATREHHLQDSSEDGRAQAESIRKMLVAMAEDIRVVLIKLADRFHNMRTLEALPAERRTAVAQETLDIYAPLAHRLGMWDMKWRLEDLAFRHLHPEEYRKISRLLVAKREQRERFVNRVCGILRAELEKDQVKAEVYGRPKHIYSIYQKMIRYSEQRKEVDQIYDLFAVRVVVPTNNDCYAALGLIHNLWHPMPGQFDDYIANPKENLYQSLHTTVMCEGTTPLEIQIRTQEMHQIADYGVAAHWRYKERLAKDVRFEEKMTWLRQLLEWQRDLSAPEDFLESVKTDIFRDQVFVYTPKGDVKELPAGSTPIDFAYHIHTELGHRCVGAKVNGKLVPLSYQLQNGDTVEILASKAARGPSLDWLNLDLGHVHTAGARQSIRGWFRRQERASNIARGRELLAKEMKRLVMSIDEEQVAHLMKFDTLEELLAALGSGGISISQVAARLTQVDTETPEEAPIEVPATGPAAGIQVLGAGDLLTYMARCCAPLPGDAIIGFITRSRGVSVHRKDCPNILNEDEKERLIKVSWGPTHEVHPARIRVVAWDRVGLLRDITTLVSGEKVNIASVVTTENPDNTATIELTVYTTGLAQLSRLFSKLEGIRGVVSVTRSSLANSVTQPTGKG